MADWNPRSTDGAARPVKTRRRRAILHGLRDEQTVSYRAVDFKTRDFILAAPVGATREQAWALAETSGLYIDHYEEEDG